ncbi:MAG: SIS domain-containing protein [Bacillota bacterium]|jgi:glucoselysine-6-phosphate deglycase|nr:SIS domain-containing protein [Bacillota bacterium]NLL26717.1 SIS domain-containing protein [Erysipelotrichia bacterium]
MEKKKTMLDYIELTPGKVLENAKKPRELTRTLTEEYISNNYDEVYIVASGSSYNSSICAKPFMEDILKVRVNVLSPSNFTTYYKHNKNDFIFIISQSGYSTNAIEALKRAKELGIKAIGVTSNVESDFKNYSDILIDYKVGIETVGYVTIGVVTLVQFLMTFALNTALELNKISKEKYDEVIASIVESTKLHQEMQKRTHEFIKKHYKSLSSMQKLYVCSSGAGMGIAYEAALKIGETVKIPAFAYDAEEYIHGPNLQLTPEYTVFVIDTNDKDSDRLKQIYQATRAVSDNAYFIGSNVDENSIYTDNNLSPLLTPLYYLPFFQLISYQITEDLNRWEQHPLLKEFKKIAASKSINFVDLD